MKKIDQAIGSTGGMVSLQDLAEEFFERINPRTRIGTYKKKSSVIGRLEGRIGSSSQVPIEFYQYLLDESNNYARLRRIITGTPAELEQNIMLEMKAIEQQYSISWPKQSVKEVIKTLGYERIRKNEANWLVQRLGIKSCPYCGSQYILSFSNPQEKKVLCELDHFFPKDTSPYLCVSFYNLIPSCGPCNRLKSSGATSLSTHPHPYVDDLDTAFVFRTDPAGAIRSIITRKTSIPIKLVPQGADTTRIDNHLKRFRLEELYPNHSDIAEELYWKKYVYNATRKQELQQIFGGQLGLTSKEVDRFITGSYTWDEDLLKRPLTKLVRDIARELGLL